MNQELGALEDQWATTVVDPLLNLVAQLHISENVGVMNVSVYLPLTQGVQRLTEGYRSRCALQPDDFRMKRPNGEPLEIEEESIKTNSNNDEGPTISRMIDRQMGLSLASKDLDRVNAAFHNMMDGEHSVNQTLGPFRTTPAFLDLELKKTESNINPEIQLAVWNAGLYLKRKYHGWDTSMPMPSIVVKGHNWE